MEIKEATFNDLETIYMIEARCFNQAEAASYEELASRLKTYGHGYDILYENGQPIGYIGGLKNDQMVLADEFYHNSSLHQPNGKWQLIFSVCIIPEYQGKGFARKMVKEYIERRKAEVDGFVLTCKDHLIPFYEKCGFQFEKVSDSTHGQAKWNDMFLKL